MHLASSCEVYYHTTDGQSLKIASVLCEHLNTSPKPLALLNEALEKGLSSFVLVAPIRFGNFHKQVYQALKHPKAGQALVGFVGVCLAARKNPDQDPLSHGYIQKFLKKTGFKPRHVALFPGRLCYRFCSFWSLPLMLLIMRITGGPTALDTDVEYTNWTKVKAFAHQLASKASPLS